MEEVTIKLVLYPYYREKAKVLGVDFEDYLTGVLISHLINGGKLDQLVKRIKHGSVAARIEAHNLAGLGEAMRGVINVSTD